MTKINGSFNWDFLAERLKNMSVNTTLFPKTEMYEVPTYVVVVLAILYGSISIIAIIGNGLVIVVIAKDKRMQTVTNIFIANLAFADVIIGVFTIPFQFYPALYQRWDFPEFLCKLAPLVKVLSVNVSVVTLTIISLDRYVAVMYPLKAGISKTYAISCLIIIWGLGIGSCFPEGYYYTVHLVLNTKVVKFQPYCEAKWPSESFAKYYHLYLLLVQYMFPLLVINFSYTRISCKIWGTKAPGNNLDREDRENIRQRNKKKVVKMLIIVVLLFVICWMPLQLYSFISEIYPLVNEYKYINIVWFCSNWLAMSNSCYNPFIYGLLNYLLSDTIVLQVTSLQASDSETAARRFPEILSSLSVQEKFKREYRLMFQNSRCMRNASADNNSSLFRNDGSDETANNSVKRITLTFRPSNSLHSNQPIRQTSNSRWGRGCAYVPYITRDRAEDCL